MRLFFFPLEKSDRHLADAKSPNTFPVTFVPRSPASAKSSRKHMGCAIHVEGGVGGVDLKEKVQESVVLRMSIRKIHR